MPKRTAKTTSANNPNARYVPSSYSAVSAPPGMAGCSEIRLVRQIVRRLLRGPGRRIHHEPALLEVQDSLRSFGGVRVVGYHDDGLVELRAQQFEDGKNLVGRPRIKVAGRLVGDDESRVGDD